MDQVRSGPARLVLFVGLRAVYGGPIWCAMQQGSRMQALAPRAERRHMDVALASWWQQGSTDGLVQLGFGLTRIPAEVLQNTVGARVGPATQQASEHAKAASLALYVARQTPRAGLFVGDFSGATCVALSVASGPGSLREPAAILLLALLRGAFLAQVPAIVLTCDPSTGQLEEVRVGLGSFVAQTGYHLAEQSLPADAWALPSRSRHCVVLTAPELGRVALRSWPERLLSEASGLARPAACSEVDRLQAVWLFGLLCERLQDIGCLVSEECREPFQQLLAFESGAPALAVPTAVAEVPSTEPESPATPPAPAPLGGPLVGCVGLGSPSDPVVPAAWAATPCFRAPGGDSSLLQSPRPCDTCTRRPGDATVALEEADYPRVALAHHVDASDVSAAASPSGPKRSKVERSIGIWHQAVKVQAAAALHEVIQVLPVAWAEPGHVPSPELQVLLGGVLPTGDLLHPCDWLATDVEFSVVACGPLPLQAEVGWPKVVLARGLGQNAGKVPVAARVEALRWQAHWLADDQVRFLLDWATDGLPGSVFVVDPLIASAAHNRGQHDELAEILLQAGSWQRVVTAVWVRGHWISFSWSRRGDKIHAWSSVPMQDQGPAAEAVAEVCCLFAKATGFNVSSFLFEGGPRRPSIPGFCGHYAVADLHQQLRCEPYGPSQAAVRLVTGGLRAFADHLAAVPEVRFPVLTGGGQPSLLEAGLSAVLKERGVPEAVILTRVREAIQRVGQGPLQAAMQSPKQWPELKAVCSNCSPPFQLVLPSELRGLIEAKAKSGEPLGPRRKQRGLSKAVSEVPGPVVPQPHQVTIPAGEFECDGVDMLQLSIQEVGPAATGVVPLSADEAKPYLNLTKPVSSKGLGLLVFGTLDLSTATVQCGSVPGPLRCHGGSFLQIGDRYVSKKAPAKLELLELAPSAIVRVALYRDERSGPWTLVTQKPIRALLEVCDRLQTCKQLGCKCKAWHGSSGAGEPEALLEVWGRTFVNDAFKTAVPDQATLFNAFLRVPAGLLHALLAFSGEAGVYFEPRGVEARHPSTEHVVTWLPKATRQEALLVKQTHDTVLGLARVGARFGVRSNAGDAEALHKLLKPGSAFFKTDGARTFHAGPWPYGSQRGAIAKALVSWG